MNNVDISIVIPFHNEAESLRLLIPALMSSIELLDETFEILFVDDASEDNSQSVVCEFMKTSDAIRMLEMPERGGQTGAYKLAFEQVRGDYIIRMDADYQDDPRDLYKFAERIREGSELIMGLRECRKHTRMLRFASAVYDLIILLIFDSPLHSNSGSYVGFKAQYVKQIPWVKNDHRYLPLIAIRRGAQNISEVIVRHRARQYGKSKYGPLKKLVFGIPEVFRFLWRYKRGYYDVGK